MLTHFPLIYGKPYMTNPLVAVQEFGQSIWYDNIRRGLITSGDLQETFGGLPRTKYLEPEPISTSNVRENG